MNYREDIRDYTRDPGNLFSQKTIDLVESTLTSISALSKKNFDEESYLATHLFEKLKKDDIGRLLLKIYEVKNKSYKADLRTLIYIKDLCISIEEAIIDPSDENVLSFIKKLVYDFIDNYDNSDEDGAFLKEEFVTLNEHNNYGVDYANRNILRIFLEKSFDLSDLSTSLQISLMVRLCSEGRKFTLPDFPLEGLFSDRAISKLKRMLGFAGTSPF